MVLKSLFDDTVPPNREKNVIEAVKTREGTDSKATRLIINKTNLNSIMQRTLSDYVSKKS